MKQSSEKVVWHEGLLMAPQHMQVQSRYHESQAHKRLSAQLAYTWGIIALSFDDARLGSDTVQLDSGQIVMPSGLLIHWEHAAGDAPLCRLLSEAAEHLAVTPMAADGSQKLDIYVGVAIEREGLSNVATQHVAQSHQRYTSHTRLISEQTFGQTAPVEVLLAVPHVQLLFAHELSNDVEAVHVMQLHLSAHGTWQRHLPFAPAALRLHLHTHYIARLHALTRVLRRAAAGLAPLGQMHKHDKGSQTPLRWSDVDGLMQLRALQSVIPLVDHIVQDPYITPREGYLLLKQALAAGAALLGGVVLDVCAYQHTAQHPWLEVMLGQLEAMAPSLGAEVTRLPMAVAERGHWQVPLPRRTLAKGARILLEIWAPDGLDEAATRWTRQAKVAAPQMLAHLLRSALPGIALSVVATLPDGMHPKAEHLYLALDLSHPTWADAVQANTVEIAPPKGADDITAVCLVIVEAHSARDVSA